MNIPVLAAEIARLIPELARDSQVNNAEFLERLIRSHADAEIRMVALTPPDPATMSMMLAISGAQAIRCGIEKCGTIVIPGANGDPVEAFPL